jgi:hypothetical protein
MPHHPPEEHAQQPGISGPDTAAATGVGKSHG